MSKSSTFKPTRLMIKRHEVSGLLYFCKTTRQDVVRYKGSGKYWSDHIKKHDRSRVVNVWVSDWFYCSSEIQDFALSFSELFNIVESDDWANLKNEDGLDGGSHKGHRKSKESVKKRSGDLHWRRTHSDAKEKMSGDNHYMHKNETARRSFANLKPMLDSSVVDKIRGDKHYMRQEGYDSSRHTSKKPDVRKKKSENMSGDKHHQYDHTVFNWVNKKTGVRESLTRHDLIKKYSLHSHQSNISMMIRGKRKSVKSWRLV